MKKLKTIVAVGVLIFTLSNCQTDEGLNQFEEFNEEKTLPIQKSLNLMDEAVYLNVNIVIHYEDGTIPAQRSSIRDLFSVEFGNKFISWEDCPADRSMELWTFQSITYSEFERGVTNLGFPYAVTTGIAGEDPNNQPSSEDPNFFLHFNVNCDDF